MTLVEIAVALVVLGALTAGFLALSRIASRENELRTTTANMDAIIQALSVYAETAGRLPCPADPAAGDVTFGWEYGVTRDMLSVAAGHFPVGSCGSAGSFRDGPANPTEGILPFLSLGLPASTARDGWGHYFTYAVSPVFARGNDEAATRMDSGKVHARCRNPGWISSANGRRRNRNAVKARFCCMDQLPPTYDADTDLIINFTKGGAVLSPVRAPGLGADYDTLERTTTVQVGNADVPVMSSSPVEAPAFVLVSHGPNGLGAYLGNDTTGRAPGAAGPELENADGDSGTPLQRRTFVDGPWNLSPGPEHFDDIVRWMTQDGILAAHGALSCQYP